MTFLAKGNHVRECIESNPAEVLPWILGGGIGGLDKQDMLDFWSITGKSICTMYYDAVKRRPRTEGESLYGRARLVDYLFPTMVQV